MEILSFSVRAPDVLLFKFAIKSTPPLWEKKRQREEKGAGSGKTPDGAQKELKVAAWGIGFPGSQIMDYAASGL